MVQNPLLLSLYGDNESMKNGRADALGIGKNAFYYYGKGKKVARALFLPTAMWDAGKYAKKRFFRGDEYETEQLETLGAFLPGLKKAVKKIGKVTSPFTTAVAKAILPSSLVNAAARFDPTKKGAAAAAGKVTTAAIQQATAQINAATNKELQTGTKPGFDKKYLIIGGAALAAVLILPAMLRKR